MPSLQPCCQFRYTALGHGPLGTLSDRKDLAKRLIVPLLKAAHTLDPPFYEIWIGMGLLFDFVCFRVYTTAGERSI